MVLKTFINYLINKYLKNYIERFDYDKVKLNLTSGKICLENLRVKPDALAYLNIPVTVAVGYLEQLKVSIPWNALTSSPTEIHIEGLYLLIVPKNEMSQDLSEHYADKFKRVQQKLDNLRKTASDNLAHDNKETAFVERMRFQVMANLVLTIRNLHISYEMKSPTKLGHPFSFGVTLHYLELTTATGIKSNKQIKEEKLLIYRLNEMNSMSIYWNANCKSRLDMPVKDVLDDLKSKIATNNFIPNDNEMKYILRPSNIMTESLVTLKPKQHHYERSKLTFSIQIPKLNFYINSEQISDILDFIKFQNYTTIYDRCREYRELLLQDSLGVQTLTPEQQQHIQFLESKLDIFHLAYIRHKVEIECSRFPSNMEMNDIDQEQQMITSQVPLNIAVQNNNTDHHRNRFNSWSKMKTSFGNLTKIHQHMRKTTTTNNLTEREVLFEDLPNIDFEIHCSKFDLNLLSSTTNARLIPNRTGDEIIAFITITDVRVSMKKMCITSRIECKGDIDSVHVFGMDREEEYRPILIKPSSSSSYPLVHFEFELFSVNPQADNRFHLTIEPIHLIYDAPSVNQLVDCFEANGNVIWQPASAKLQHISMTRKQKLSYKKIFDMTINFKGVSVLLPEFGVHQQGFGMIYIHFGNILLKSCLDTSDEDIDRSLFKIKYDEQRFYAKYKLELCDLRIIYSKPNRKRLHILRRTSLIDINFYRYIASNASNSTNWRIDLKIVMGDIQLSKKTLTKIILHLKSLPLIYSNISIIVKRINFYFTLFSPCTIVVSDLSIYNCCLRLLMLPQTSVRSDFHIYLTTARDQDFTNTNTSVALNEPKMMQHITEKSKQSTRLFYRGENIELVYYNSYTKL
ncbi:unnamed protein product [Rotaria socialis]|uniref:Chorein N-terminal domain-containing protein n=1 Tax=Rotaria socialis TaxID=392032 RepID=A0A820JCB4_9BILA|nr:unnamed protein product [Rotaria socialis]CAF3313511.1 unnamed protein product [Rotaria socialis]CAF3341192.1 unnamed protein product [Rotaria socialis]CAF3603192.1 unnamed protein product [Rotaria socialis]CAF4115338.1 unnamed protein product [Rotaria socialis]